MKNASGRSGRGLKASTADGIGKLRLRAWLHLLFAVQEIERRIRPRLSAEFGETLARLDVLAALSRLPEGVTMTELSGLLRLTKGNITGLIARLERDGLVTRHARDGRTAIVKLSRKGEGLFRKMASAHEGWINELLGALNSSEVRGLIDILSKLRPSLQGKAEREY